MIKIMLGFLILVLNYNKIDIPKINVVRGLKEDLLRAIETNDENTIRKLAHMLSSSIQIPNRSEVLSLVYAIRKSNLSTRELICTYINLGNDKNMPEIWNAILSRGDLRILSFLNRGITTDWIGHIEEEKTGRYLGNSLFQCCTYRNLKTLKIIIIDQNFKRVILANKDVEYLIY